MASSCRTVGVGAVAAGTVAILAILSSPELLQWAQAPFEGQSPPASDAGAAPQPGPASPPQQPQAVASPTYPRVKKRQKLRVWSVEELALHNGTDAARPLLLAIVGEVFDVGPGAKFYGPGQGYELFAGSDRTPGFGMGPGPTTSSMEDLDIQKMMEVFEWRDFYRNHDKYRFVGVVDERYYDAAGEPTAELRRVEQLHKGWKDMDRVAGGLQGRYKNCNSKFTSAAKTTDLWCSDSYHGAGAKPRFVKHRVSSPLDGLDPLEGARCACFTDGDLAEIERSGGPSPNAQLSVFVYPECGAQTQSCTRPKDAPSPA